MHSGRRGEILAGAHFAVAEFPDEMHVAVAHALSIRRSSLISRSVSAMVRSPDNAGLSTPSPGTQGRVKVARLAFYPTVQATRPCWESIAARHE